MSIVINKTEKSYKNESIVIDKTEKSFKNESIVFYKTEKSFKNDSLVEPTKYILKNMTEDSINNNELKCESNPEKHTESLQALSEGKVNLRASNCASYLKSLYHVIYPKGINPRKK